MPFKLVLFLIALVFLSFFIGFNLENRCDVSVVFRTFRDVPVIGCLLFSFAAGAVSVVPFIFGAARQKKKKARDDAVSTGTGTRSKTRRGSARGEFDRKEYDID